MTAIQGLDHSSDECNPQLRFRLYPPPLRFSCALLGTVASVYRLLSLLRLMLRCIILVIPSNE